MLDRIQTPQNDAVIRATSDVQAGPKSSQGVTCVVPAWNESPAIEPTCAQALAALQSLNVPFQLIVVDDGSSDDTAAKARAAGATVISHPMNAGYGRSLKTGIDSAMHDTIVIMDADGTYPIDRVGELLAEYDRGIDMVVAQRQGAAYRESLIKMPLRIVLKSIVEFVSGREVPDVNSGLRVFSRASVRSYYPHLCDTFSFTSSLTLSYLMSGRFVKFLPMPYGERIGKTKVRIIRDSLRSLQYVFQQAIYYNPLKIFFSLSAFCLVLSALFLILGVGFQIRTAFFLAAGSFLVALIVVAMGILGELLKQIMGQGLTSAQGVPADPAPDDTP